MEYDEILQNKLNLLLNNPKIVEISKLIKDIYGLVYKRVEDYSDHHRIEGILQSSLDSYWNIQRGKLLETTDDLLLDTTLRIYSENKETFKYLGASFKYYFEYMAVVIHQEEEKNLLNHYWFSFYEKVISSVEQRIIKEFSNLYYKIRQDEEFIITLNTYVLLLNIPKQNYKILTAYRDEIANYWNDRMFQISLTYQDKLEMFDQINKEVDIEMSIICILFTQLRDKLDMTTLLNTITYGTVTDIILRDPEIGILASLRKNEKEIVKLFYNRFANIGTNGLFFSEFEKYFQEAIPSALENSPQFLDKLLDTYRKNKDIVREIFADKSKEYLIVLISCMKSKLKNYSLDFSKLCLQYAIELFNKDDTKDCKFVANMVNYSGQDELFINLLTVWITDQLLNFTIDTKKLSVLLETIQSSLINNKTKLNTLMNDISKSVSPKYSTEEINLRIFTNQNVNINAPPPMELNPQLAPYRNKIERKFEKENPNKRLLWCYQYDVIEIEAFNGNTLICNLAQANLLTLFNGTPSIPITDIQKLPFWEKYLPSLVDNRILHQTDGILTINYKLENQHINLIQKYKDKHASDNAVRAQAREKIRNHLRWLMVKYIKQEKQIGIGEYQEKFAEEDTELFESCLEELIKRNIISKEESILTYIP